jgi:flagellar basal-body rod protein FlgC
MNLFGVLDLSASALQAQRQRAEVVASNLANAETTHTSQGGPYQKQEVVFGPERLRPGSFDVALASFTDVHMRGVRVERVVTDQAAPVRRYEPGHPDADSQGYVSFPAINPTEEMVNLMNAARSYQMNVSAVQATKTMIQDAITILQ